MAAQQKNWVPIVMLVAIAGLLLGGLFTYRASTYDPSVVKCGDEVMAQGDTCVAYGGDSDTGTGSYDEVKADQDASNRVNQIVGPIALGVGGLFLVIGIAGIVVRRRALSRMSS